MKKKVALAISGGIDSAISAYLLQEMGYEVVGVHFQFWTWEKNLSNSATLRKTLIDDIKKKIGIRVETIKKESFFKKTIVNNFLSDLSKGHTPNPCVRCNPFVKFKLLRDFAEKEKIFYISTGHYARIKYNRDRNFKLIKGIDSEKDQSYVLCNLNQKLLSRAIFPLGETYKKDNIVLGKSLDLKIIEFPESQDLCFVSTNHYKQFISESIPNSIQPGDIIDNSKNIIGQHKGLVYYTIGQRKNIRVSAEKPYYVIRKDFIQNRLVVGHIDELGRDQMIVNNLNWITKQPKMPFTCDVKIRYRSPYVRCRIEIASESAIKVNLSRKLRDITPGQYAVFYSGDEVLGGGIIFGKEQ